MKKIPEEIMMLQSSEIIFQGSKWNSFCISIWITGAELQAVLEDNSVTDVQMKKEHKIHLLCVQ